ncbi:NAD(P)-binding protein [Dendryphion nanum]|uniref:NAD(P)-binding protein n=1 Tax=Dendryphion nanum TaxID=256645 RepID=A0A9P9E405_9PLEO|nr:NAD(P)-binding protein [Dendryphion nanum]
MSPKILITGGTGYIGGSVLHTIATTHPEYALTALLRTIPPTFSTQYPNIEIVKGDYDSFDILADAASKVDIVIHNGDSDHLPSLQALTTGLLRRSTPTFLLHLSGTGIVSDYLTPTYLGIQSPQIWSDDNQSDLHRISTLPDTALHRNTEKFLNETIAKHGDRLNVAIICPPDIYGKGLGLGKTESAFVTMYVQQIRRLGGKVIYYGQGENTRSWVHVRDLMRLYEFVVEAAVEGGGSATWGKEGYYFAGTQETSNLDIARATGEILKKHGVIENPEPVALPLDEIDALIDYPGYPLIARYLFAGNSRTRADRAKRLFGYEGREKTVLEALEEDILVEIGKK